MDCSEIRSFFKGFFIEQTAEHKKALTPILDHLVRFMEEYMESALAVQTNYSPSNLSFVFWLKPGKTEKVETLVHCSFPVSESNLVSLLTVRFFLTKHFQPLLKCEQDIEGRLQEAVLRFDFGKNKNICYGATESFLEHSKINTKIFFMTNALYRVVRSCVTNFNKLNLLIKT